LKLWKRNKEAEGRRRTSAVGSGNNRKNPKNKPISKFTHPPREKGEIPGELGGAASEGRVQGRPSLKV